MKAYTVHDKTITVLLQKVKASAADIIAALFILLFAYTGINKLLSIDAFLYVVKEYPIIGNYASLIIWWVPAMELMVVVWLLIPRTRLLGLYAALVLMVAFTSYIGYLLLYSTKKYCTCGGMLEFLTLPQHIAFNIFFILLAVTGIWLDKKRRRRGLA